MQQSCFGHYWSCRAGARSCDPQLLAAIAVELLPFYEAGERRLATLKKGKSPGGQNSGQRERWRAAGGPQRK